MRFGISQTLFALVALIGSAASAAAQEAPAQDNDEPTLAAAANDPNLSTIHGQLVPVGEHNEYKYRFRPFNLSTNPIGAMLGLYSISASYGISQNVALRADFTYADPIDRGGGSSKTWTQMGVSAPIYLRRTYQGAFVEPGFVSRETQRHEDYTGAPTTATTTEMGPEVLVGWHWTWDSGLNIAFAFGAGRNLKYDEKNDSYSNDPLIYDGYLRVGYAF